MRKLLSFFIMAITLTACSQQKDTSKFVTVENGHFVKNGKPYYYVGTNFWYGAILGSEGQGGRPERARNRGSRAEPKDAREAAARAAGHWSTFTPKPSGARRS